MNRIDELIEKVRDIARIGVVNYKKDRAVLEEAARELERLDRKCEDLEERVAIMMEGETRQQTVMEAVEELRK